MAWEATVLPCLPEEEGTGRTARDGWSGGVTADSIQKKEDKS